MFIEPIEVLKKYWGYEAFRPMQADIIESVLAGNNTLALMPTGGGKSITYQVPALTGKGLCIVITPLIALMKDQVEQLENRGIKARKIHTGLYQKEIVNILNACIYTDVKFLYISPERIHTEIFQQKVKEMPLNLIAVDEAHCISQWGYDFRPSYLHIAKLREYHPGIPVIAVTATATPKVVDDIADKLKLQPYKFFKKSFTRENLVYYVRSTNNKITDLLKTVTHLKGSGIIYVRNRKKTKELAELLTQHNISAGYYHAGLDHAERDEKQNSWQKGKLRIMVSTNAFGMGIDKANVRFVLHFDLPDSLEAYFQEAGRAGRDEKKAFAILLYSNTDIANLKKRVEQNFPDISDIKKIYQSVCNYLKIPVGSGKGMTYDFDLFSFSQSFHMQALKVYSSLRLLQQSGYIEYTEEVNLASRMVFNVPRDDLYKFQVENETFDSFVKLLLRSYTGLFTEYTSVSETYLAGKMGTNAQTIYKYLVQLSKSKIISYIPRKNKPVISFSEERLEDKNLRISPEFFTSRKQQYSKQVEKVISYATTQNKCRNLFMLHYFGEKSDQLCGQCDTCQEKTDLTLNTSQLNEISDSIRRQLSYGSLTLPQLAEALSLPHDKLKEAVQYLLDKELLKSNNDGILQWIK